MLQKSTEATIAVRTMFAERLEGYGVRVIYGKTSLAS
jgi:hypothetical protein